MSRSRKTGGEGIVHTRTHVKFGSDGESSDGEYEDAQGGGAADAGAGVGDGMQVDDGVQGAGKAFDQQLVGYCVRLHARWLLLPRLL